MDSLSLPLTCFYDRRFDECAKLCTKLLEANSTNEVAWLLKLRSLVEISYIDMLDVDTTNLEEVIFQNSANSCCSRPGTTLKTPKDSKGGLSQAVRPSNLSERPVTGMVRKNLASRCNISLEQAVHTGRTAKTARPVTSMKGGQSKTGTVLTLSDGEEFIHVARLNLAKYANKPELARNLFEYLFFVVQEIRLALNLASMVCNKPNASDLKGITSIGDGRYEEWWWKLQKAKCFYRLGLLRESDTAAQESNEILPTIETFLLRGAISLRQNQPLKALSLYRDGLLRFPKDPELMSNAARIHENIGEMLKSIDVYKDVIRVDNTNIEALASFGTHYFYEDQPELALKFFRRILQLGFQSAELYNNLGLCSYYAQQYDVCLSYFQKAIEMCNLENAADVYFSLAHIGINIGDLKLAYQCLRIALAYDNNHSEAYNNLGVIEERRGNFSAAKTFYRTACELFPNLFEPHRNLAFLSALLGELQTSYQFARRTLVLFPNRKDVAELLKQLLDYFSST